MCCCLILQLLTSMSTLNACNSSQIKIVYISYVSQILNRQNLASRLQPGCLTQGQATAGSCAGLLPAAPLALHKMPSLKNSSDTSGGHSLPSLWVFQKSSLHRSHADLHRPHPSASFSYQYTDIF